MRCSLADRPVVAVKSLLSGGGGGAKGPAHQDCYFDQPGPQGSGRKRGEHASVASQAVRYSQTAGLGGV
jgi:hypothetical protein